MKLKRAINYLYFCLLSVFVLDSVTYSGFVTRHTHLNIWFFLICFAFVDKIISRENIHKIIPVWVVNTGIIIWLLLITLESITYQNFVFSHFHLNLESTSVLISLLLWSQIADRLNNQSVFIVIGCFIGTLYTTRATYRILQSGLTRNFTELSNLSKSYDEKMANEYGPSYYLYQFVAENTPNDTSIMVPPQISPWIYTGNVGLSRYFLGNRVLINGKLDSLPEGTGAKYVMISIEDDNSRTKKTIWPNFKISSEQVISFDPVSKETKTVESFNPDYFLSNNLLGIIKLKQ